MRCPIAIGTGLGFAAEAGNPLIEAMLTDYQGRSFYKEDGTVNLTACPYYNTKVLRKLLPSLIMNDQTQSFDLISILSNSEYQQFACHHGAMSWTDAAREHIAERPYKDTRLKRFLRSPQKIQFMEDHFPESIFRFLYLDCLGFFRAESNVAAKKGHNKAFKKGR